MEKQHQCSKCPKSFDKQSRLQRHHETTHEAVRPFQCEECPKSFARKDHFKDHVALHAGQRRHTCPDCQLTFTKKIDLQKHVDVHSLTDVVECSVCNAKFRSSATLKVHMARRHAARGPSGSAIRSDAKDDGTTQQTDSPRGPMKPRQVGTDDNSEVDVVSVDNGEQLQTQAATDDAERTQSDSIENEGPGMPPQKADTGSRFVKSPSHPTASGVSQPLSGLESEEDEELDLDLENLTPIRDHAEGNGTTEQNRPDKVSARRKTASETNVDIPTKEALRQVRTVTPKPSTDAAHKANPANHSRKRKVSDDDDEESEDELFLRDLRLKFQKMDEETKDRMKGVLLKTCVDVQFGSKR